MSIHAWRFLKQWSCAILYLNNIKIFKHWLCSE